MNDVKRTLIKAIRLEQCFKIYSESEQTKKEVLAKFTAVWGKTWRNIF
jgi:hypothetical protein